MPPISVDEVGIQQISDFTLLQQAEVEKVLEESEPIVKSDGTLDTVAGHAFNPTFNFVFTGKGDLPAGLAVATEGNFTHEEISGGRTLVTRLKTGEASDRHNNWEIAGKNCPGAVEWP